MHTCGISRRATVLALSLLPVVVSGHHSRAEYSEQSTEFEGEFVRVAWTNPHPTFSFSVASNDGTQALIELQAWGSPYTLQRAGVTGARFRTGERVRIAARASTRREGQYVLTHTLFPEGLEVVLNLNDQARWSQNAIGSQTDYFASDANVITDAAAQDRGIFRVWSSPARPEPGSTQTVYALTDAAAAIKAAYDPLTDFAAQCQQPGMPRFMANPAAYEFVDEGDFITIRNAHYDPIRTIHMSVAGDPQAQPASILGYSVGHWEDDVLVVHTTRIDFPYFDLVGTPILGSPEVFERFTLSEDQARLDYHMSVTDPATFDGTATVDRYLVALGESPEPYDCRVDQ